VGLCVLAMLGVASRITVPAATVLAFILLAYMNCFGKIHHSYNLPILIMIALSFARSGDGFALDALIRRSDPPPAPSGDYGWPIFFARLCFAGLMCLGGISKVFGRWIPPNPQTFEFLFARNWALAELKAVPLSGLTIWFSNHGWLALGFAYAALALELAAPVTLFRRGMVRFAVIGGLLGMQVFNAVVLGIHMNLPWLAGYVAFLDIEGLLARRVLHPPGPAASAVAVDAE
jgi:hypothetical protein